MLTKEKIFRQMYENQVKRDEYFDKIPSDINGVVFDNQYVNLMDMDRHILMDYVFGEHVEAVAWFLYEWKPGYEVGCNGVTAKINSIDEYINWMKEHEGFNDD